MKLNGYFLLSFVLFPALSRAQGDKLPTDPAAKPAADKVSMLLTQAESKLVEDYRNNTIELPKSSTTTYKATVFNTNFIVPILRFNPINSGPTNNQKGNVSLFNSIGAGVSLNAGRLELTTNDKSEIINREMHNTFGAQVGFLAAVNAGSTNDANIFAPTFSLMFFNFNAGVGYELGSLPANEDRLFFTVAYGIPVAKLVKGGFYVYKMALTPANTRNGFN